MHTVSWHVVVPVKGTGAAKSRLAPVVGDAREEFARALALDTLVATAQTPGVRLVVVSGDPIVAGEAAALGALVVPDPSAGLGAAVAAGIEVCLAEGGEARGEGTDESPASGVAVLLGDLPALRPRDLSEALAVCATEDSAFVPAADGTGTVLLAARRPKDLRPSFGPGSAAAHSRVAARLDLDLPRLRRDVDVAADLEAVLTLGVGAHTAAALARLPELDRPRSARAEGGPEPGPAEAGSSRIGRSRRDGVA